MSIVKLTESCIANDLKYPDQGSSSICLTVNPPQGGESGTRCDAQVTNAEFVDAVYSKLPDMALAAVCSKSGDPTEGGWPARPADSAVARLIGRTNNYINCASFRADTDGSFRARKANFAACHFIMLDDVGSKVPLDRFGEFKLSWLIETSPGNYQGGIILDPPLTDSDQATQLLDTVTSRSDFVSMTQAIAG